MAPRRDSAAIIGGGGIDAHVTGGVTGDTSGGWGDAMGDEGGGKEGVVDGSCAGFVRFRWDEGMRLVREEGKGCEWGVARGGPGPVVQRVRGAGGVGWWLGGGAPDMQLHHKSTGLSTPFIVPDAKPHLTNPARSKVYPDCSYCRQPPDLRALVTASAREVTFEAGTVLRDGGVGRWLLTYDLQVRWWVGWL